ncbi:hypothetical protein EPI10_032003 [Gossypium australe]|uniref:Uncharacterized protein n=1 Tax=Gossypium australe TaxID=47621 RepID=A0A5B6X518_9ROSI|nr:hypothetical protein EPI10_032003 [Gossypium australe]
MGQLANELRSRPQGALPNDMKNPRNLGKEHCKKNFGCIETTTYQHSICGSFGENVELCESYEGILSKKKRFGEFETVALTTKCTLFLQNRLPPKLKDPGSFNIRCNIGQSYYGKALCD